MARLGIDAVRGFPRSVYVVAVGQFVNLFGRGVVYPFSTLYFYRIVGIPFTLVGLGLLANSIATAVGIALGGYLADRRGRKPVMVASMGLSAATLAAYSLVRTAPAFFVVATASGLTMGLYTPASQAMIADLTAAADRESGYGLLKVANNAGFGLGFVAGGLLFAVARRAVFVVDGATSGVVAVVLAVVLPAVHGGDRAATLREQVGEWGRAVSRPRLLAVAALNVGFAVCYAQMGTTVPVFAEGHLGMDSGAIGTLWVLNPLTVVLLQMPIVAWASERRRTRGLVLSSGFWALSFVAVLAAYPAPPLAGIALVGAFLVTRTIGELLHSPLVTALVSDMADLDTRGSQLSVLSVAKRLGFGIGPVIGGAFFDLRHQRLLWVALIGLCVAIAVGLLALERSVSPAENGVDTVDGTTAD